MFDAENRRVPLQMCVHLRTHACFVVDVDEVLPCSVVWHYFFQRITEHFRPLFAERDLARADIPVPHPQFGTADRYVQPVFALLQSVLGCLPIRNFDRTTKNLLDGSRCIPGEHHFVY